MVLSPYFSHVSHAESLFSLTRKVRSPHITPGTDRHWPSVVDEASSDVALTIPSRDVPWRTPDALLYWLWVQHSYTPLIDGRKAKRHAPTWIPFHLFCNTVHLGDWQRSKHFISFQSTGALGPWGLFARDWLARSNRTCSNQLSIWGR